MLEKTHTHTHSSSKAHPKIIHVCSHLSQSSNRKKLMKLQLTWSPCWLPPNKGSYISSIHRHEFCLFRYQVYYISNGLGNRQECIGVTPQGGHQIDKNYLSLGRKWDPHLFIHAEQVVMKSSSKEPRVIESLGQWEPRMVVVVVPCTKP
jgi:hypothetical protein